MEINNLSGSISTGQSEEEWKKRDIEIYKCCRELPNGFLLEVSGSIKKSVMSLFGIVVRFRFAFEQNVTFRMSEERLLNKVSVFYNLTFPLLPLNTKLVQHK